MDLIYQMSLALFHISIKSGMNIGFILEIMKTRKIAMLMLLGPCSMLIFCFLLVGGAHNLVIHNLVIRLAKKATATLLLPRIHGSSLAQQNCMLKNIFL